MVRHYEAEKDLGMQIFIWICVAIVLMGIVTLYVFTDIGAFGLIMVTILYACVCLFVLSILFGTYYELQRDVLYIKSGFFSETIPYERITSARFCRNYMSSMALAADRIELKHGDRSISGTTYISPKEREEFMQILCERCPHVVFTENEEEE